MIQSRYIAFLSFVIGMIFSGSGLKAEKLIIGVEEIEYAPYYFTQNGQYKGFARTLFDAFGQEYGYEIEYKPYPIKRLYRALIDQNIDLKFPDNPNWGNDIKSQHTIFYSQPIVGYIDGVMVKVPSSSASKKPLQHIAIVRGFSPWPLMPLIQQNQIQTREVNSLKSALLLTLNDRVQGAYFNVKVAQHLMAQDLQQPNALILSEILPYDRNNYFASTGNSDRLATLKQLQHFLLSEKGQALFKQYNMTVNP